MKNNTEIKTTKRIYMKQIVMIAVATLLITFQGLSQNITISMDTVKAYRNDSVVMPVYVSNFSNVGAITLYIQFDTTKLVWGRALSWNSGLNGNIPLLHHKNGIIGISWIDVTGVTLADGLLFELKFKHRQGHAPVTIGSASEFANPNGIILNHNALDGLIWEGLTLVPDTNVYTICIGSSIVLNPKPRGGFGTLTYSWSSSAGGFSSTQPTISVSPVVTTSYSVTVTDGIDYEDTTFSIGIYPNIVPVAPTNMVPADSATGLFSPYSFSWPPSPHATHYDLYLWPAIGAMPSTPTVANISQINYSHHSSLAPGTWFKWKVVAKNACYSTPSQIQNFQVRALPDLHVTAMSTSPPISGQTMTVQWTVTNDGLGPTTVPQWTDKIWLSSNFDVRIAEADNILLGQYQNVSALNPGQSYVNTATVQIPPNLMGPYFIWAMSDMIDVYFGGNIIPDIPYNPPPYLNSAGMHGSGILPETNNLDNFYYMQLIFPIPPLADLVTTDLVTPGAMFSGQQVGISYTVKNHGTNTTPSGIQWFDKIWLTTDTIFNLQSAVLLATRNHNTPIDPDSTYKDSVVVNIPNNIYGTFYIYIQNDATNQIFENIGEDNNGRFSDPITIFLTPPADLTVAFMNFPDTASVLETVPISFTVVNQGGLATPSSGYWDAIYISALDTFNLNQSTLVIRQKHTSSVPIGGSYSSTFNSIIPKWLNGNYYLYIKTDQENQVFEHTNKSNNILRSAYPIAILRPDFEPTMVTIPAVDNTGTNIPVTWRMYNNGPGTHVKNYMITTYLYLSTNPVYHHDSLIYVSNKFTSPSLEIPPGGYVDLTQNIIIPDGKPGPFYLYVHSDWDENYYEVDENNNIGRSTNAIQVERPDLVVTKVNVPASATSGNQAFFSWTVKNTGNGSMTLKTWRDKLVMSRLPVYNPDSTIDITTFKHENVSLASGDSITHSGNYKIPHGYQGNIYFYVITDINNEVYEKTGEFNNVSNPSDVVVMTLGPWADLEIMSITLQDTATQGDLVPIVFTIKNTGTKTTSNTGWRDRVYLSSSPVWNSSNLSDLTTQIYTSELLPDSSYTMQIGVNISLSVAEGFYYMYIFTDFQNSIYEYIDEGNNIMRSTPIYINPYPPIDLAVTSVTAPATANSGNPVTVGWGVQNTGAGKTISANWYDAIYLSQDPLFSPSTDHFLAEKKKNGPLSPGQTYSSSQQVTIPNGLSGTWYFLVITDYMDVNYDINRNNNTGTPQPIAITLTPSPDLVITDFSAPVSGISGQPVTVTWKVLNNGAGNTLSNGWVDRFYLSSDYTIDNMDKILGSKSYSGNIAPGQFYEDTADFFIPAMAAGNYILIIKTDNNNNEYEHNAEGNNTVSGMMFVTTPPPADLIAKDIIIPDSAFANDQVTISWKVKNQEGSHTASGWMKDNLYLSTDTVWEVTDMLVGNVFSNVNILPLLEINRSVTFKLPGITPGHYYAIVRTDVSNNINETDEDNNTTASMATIFIDVEELPLEVLLNDTLDNLVEKHYRITIPDSLTGESMITYLEGDSANGVNELYLTHNQISSRIVYDYVHSTPYLPDQEVIVPFLDSGAYYLLAFGYNNTAPYQKISLLADIMEFDIRSVFDDKGGNSGPVTVLLEGSKFDSLMMVYLDSNGIIIPATALHFIDITEAYATFDLTGATPGLYDVVAVNNPGDTAIFEDGFRIIQGESPRLGINLVHPANSRPGRVSAFTIEFGNLGNVDLVAPVIKVESLVGAPIALDPGGLPANNTTMLIPLSIPGEPPGILRPGISGSIIIYTKSTKGLGFMVTKQ